jgi:succinyl-diaminopimelate desuccinylase
MPAGPQEQTSHVHPRLNITIIRGGTKPNVIPAECELWVNRRYIPEEPLESVLAELEDAARVEGIAIDIEGLMAHLPPVRDPLGPHWPFWESALARGFGFQPADFTYYGAASSSDMGWVQGWGIQEILLGGVSRPDGSIHGPDEWVSVDDLESLALAIAVYLTDQVAAETQFIVGGEE